MLKVIDFCEASKSIVEKQEAQGLRRQAWAGLSDEEAKCQGSELLAMLYQRANEAGLQLRELAAVLNVTYGYIYQLKIGKREVSQVSDDFVAACSVFLNKPKLYVLALAGKLNLADYYEPASIEADLDDAITLMYKDASWGGFMPLSLKEMGIRERLFLVRLYESATGRTLINKLDIEKMEVISK